MSQQGSAAELPANQSLWRLPAVLLLAAYTMLAFAGFFVTLASLPAWLARGGTAESAAGTVTTVLLAATVVTQLAVPQLVARFGLRVVLAAGQIFLGLPTLGLLIDGGFWWVLMISVLRGIGFGIATVLGSTMTARIVPLSRRGEAIGIYGLAIAVPNLLALPGGVALVTAGHFAPVAIIGAAPLVGLLVVPALARAGAERPGPQQSGPEPVTAATTASTGGTAAAPGHATGTERAAVRQSRREARIAAIAPSAVLTSVTLVGAGFLTYVPILRPDGALATLAIVVWGITGAFARWRVGLLADRSGLRVLLPASSVVSIVGIGIVVAGLLLGTGPAGWAVTLLGAAVLGLGYGASQNLTLVSAFEQARQRETETVSSVWNAGFDAGTAVGAGLVGALTIVVSIPAALALTAVFVIGTLPWAVRSGRPPTRTR